MKAEDGPLDRTRLSMLGEQWDRKPACTGRRREQGRKWSQNTEEQGHGHWLWGKRGQEGFFLRMERSQHVFVLTGKIHERGEMLEPVSVTEQAGGAGD